MTTVPTPATSGVPTAQPIRPPEPGLPLRGSADAPTTCGDAEHRGDQAEPADGQPAAGLRSRTAAEQPQRGEEQHDRQHHEQRADDPADGVGQTGADRADAVAPRRGAEHDRQPEDGEADPVAPVLGGQRFGLLRPGDRPGETTGAAGQQVPAAADHAPQAGRALLLGGTAGRGTLGGRPLLARSRRAGASAPGGRRSARRRGAGRHASDGNRRSAGLPASGRTCPALRPRGHNVTVMTSALPHGSWPTPITSELVVARGRAPRRGRASTGTTSGGRGPPERGRPVGRSSAAPPTGRSTDVLPPPWNARTRVHEYGGGAWTASGGTLWFTEFATSGCTGWTPAAATRSR